MGNAGVADGLFGHDEFVGPDAEAFQAEAERALEMLRLLEAKRYLTNYRAFVTECLGLDFPEIHDPGVQRDLDEQGAILLDWIQTYKCMNKVCFNWISTKDASGITHRKRRPANSRDHICQYQKERRLVLIERPRGTCKSSGLTIPFFCFIHAHLPEVAMLLMSAEYERMAKKYSSSVRQHWEGQEGSKLIELFGKHHDPANKWTDDKMYSARRSRKAGDATLSTTSIETGATGFHVKAAVIDDPTTKALVRKHGDRWHEKVWDEFNEMNTVVDKDGILICVYTRYGMSDLPGKIKQQMIRPSTMEALGDEPEDFDARWAYYAKRFRNIDVLQTKAVQTDADGKIVHMYPTIWSADRIKEVRSMGAKGEEFYATQLQNNPSDRADNPITDGVLTHVRVRRDQIDSSFYFDMTLHLDTAFKNIENIDRGDWNVIEVIGHSEGRVALLWAWRGRVTQQEFGEQFVRALQWCHGKKYLKSEAGHEVQINGKSPRMITKDKPTAGESGEKQWLVGLAHQYGMPCPRILEINRNEGMSGTDKKHRAIRSMFGYIQDGRVLVPDDIHLIDDLFYEWRNLGYADHDDLADAFKDCFHNEIYRPAGRASHGMVREGRRGPLPMVRGEFDEEAGRFIFAKRRSAFERSNIDSPFGRSPLGRALRN